jgi:hypothetical protein
MRTICSNLAPVPRYRHDGRLPVMPHPQPLKQRYPWGYEQERSMTIVAGFLIQEHVVLCADTMVTSGIKIHQSKLQGFHAGEVPRGIPSVLR